ncbi:perlucin-like protein [Asterias amurensis]|uniref:perlucin-like protein n=1 Tax=Asterias amurensis TaxID=7602 RepID=UPI003AB33894
MGGFCLPSVLLILFTIGTSSAHLCKPHQMVCPFGWESWGGSCYKLIEEQMTWHEGRLKCQEMGGDMVAPSSSEENNHMDKLRKSKYDLFVWINCNDLEMEGQWDCAPDNGGYRNWDKTGEPGGGTQENCALIEIRYNDFAWHDYPCSLNYSTICKGEEVMATQVKLKQWRLLASCLTGHTLREIPTSNVRACATVCHYDPIFRSFNVQHFGTGERICQLNSVTRNEADHTQFVKSKKHFTCIYGER